GPLRRHRAPPRAGAAGNRRSRRRLTIQPLHARRWPSYDPVVTSPDATALAGDRSRHDLEAEVESHRRELTAYCYRMLGSNLEAEDAVQDTMVRAWRSLDGFEGRSSLRSWLYRIATNVCIDMT